ncbi:MAG TPA: ATP-binding protein, partial [Herpetosiphonaceae bacterium]
DVVQVARPRGRQRDPGVAITPVLELGQVPIVNGSAFELREVLINLIFNAVDAMPDGGTLTLQTGVEHNGVSIEVRDTGIGMSEETLAQMWTPFFTTKGVHGTGLGLTMTHTIIVQQYSGRINVQSAEGAGTSITVWLPLGDEAAGSAPAPAEPVEQRKARILLIEQEPLVQSALAGLIETWGYEVTCADSGLEGLALAERQRFDVAISDISLTDLTAWELMGALKQLDGQIRTILLTVWGTNIDADQGATVMDAMIPKPFEAEAVRETLAQLLAPAAVLDP